MAPGDVRRNPQVERERKPRALCLLLRRVWPMLGPGNMAYALLVDVLYTNTQIQTYLYRLQVKTG